MTSQAQYFQHAHLPLQFGPWAAYFALKVYGGPFDARPKLPQSFNVCVRAERVPKDAIHAWLPIEDFEVPEPKHLDRVNDVLFQALQAAIDCKHVYVGCMGGVGRTGLFLALLAKAADLPDPIGYVRGAYDRRAVETSEQRQYVATFDVKPLQRRLFWHAWRVRARSWCWWF